MRPFIPGGGATSGGSVSESQSKDRSSTRPTLRDGDLEKQGVSLEAAHHRASKQTAACVPSFPGGDRPLVGTKLPTFLWCRSQIARFAKAVSPGLTRGGMRSIFYWDLEYPPRLRQIYGSLMTPFVCGLPTVKNTLAGVVEASFSGGAGPTASVRPGVGFGPPSGSHDAGETAAAVLCNANLRMRVAGIAASGRETERNQHSLCAGQREAYWRP
jgi:hypothetical protein